jgi:hypothetical protein
MHQNDDHRGDKINKNLKIFQNRLEFLGIAQEAQRGQHKYPFGKKSDIPRVGCLSENKNKACDYPN